MGDDTKLKYDVIQKLIATKTSTRVLIDSFSIFKPSKDKIWKIIVVVLISIIPAMVISFQENTVLYFSGALDTVLNLMLAMFGIIFTGYAIPLILLGDFRIISPFLQSTNFLKSLENPFIIPTISKSPFNG